MVSHADHLDSTTIKTTLILRDFLLLFVVKRGFKCATERKQTTSGCREVKGVMTGECKHTQDEWGSFSHEMCDYLMRSQRKSKRGTPRKSSIINRKNSILWYREQRESLKPCWLHKQTAIRKLCPPGMSSQPGWQCRAAMCGGKHTGPLPLCCTDSDSTPPSHLLLQLIGPTPEKQWSHLFWFTKAWNSLFWSTGKVSSVSSETAKSLSVFKRGGGVVNLTDSTVSFYLPSCGLSSEHSWMLLNGVLWVTCEPRDHQRFMGDQ